MIYKNRQKWLVKKSTFVWWKKNPSRSQIFRYFRIESRNNKFWHKLISLHILQLQSIHLEREISLHKPLEFFVPTFDTKVTEYLCSGWVFFSSDKFRLFTVPFLTEFFNIIRKLLLSWAQIWKDISPVIIFRKVMGV